MTIRDHIAWIAQDLKIATEECIKKKKRLRESEWCL